MERACASSVDLHFLAEEDIPKLDMKALKYLFEYQQPEERWIPAPRRKLDLVAAVQELKARGSLSAAEIHERFGPREQSDDSEMGEEEGWIFAWYILCTSSPSYTFVYLHIRPNSFINPHSQNIQYQENEFSSILFKFNSV